MPNSKGDPKGAEQATPDKDRRQKSEEEKEESLDKTIEDSFPASDPPSSIPDPDEKEDAA
ncbi:MAG TPA: hypothetical protein VH596_01585 [Terriglobales bacterium]|jgi:hypothetical protein